MPALRQERPGDELPARDLGEIRMAGLLAGDGCPLCGALAAAEERLVDALLGEAVNDVGVRSRLDRAGGFCERHTRLLPVRERARRGGVLGTAILLGAVAQRRIEQDGRAACPLCTDVAAASATAVSILLSRVTDAAWADAMSHAGFCDADLRHLSAVGARDRRVAAAWQPIAVAQRARLERLIADARGYVAHSAHDRAAEMTDDERAAADRLVDWLAGSEGESGSARRSQRR